MGSATATTPFKQATVLQGRYCHTLQASHWHQDLFKNAETFWLLHESRHRQADSGDCKTTLRQRLRRGSAPPP